MTRLVYTCPNCGSTRVQETCWVDLNTREVLDSPEPPEYWCPDCEEHPRQVVQLELPFDTAEELSRKEK